MKISINVKSDSNNSYTDNVKLTLQEFSGLIYLTIDDGDKREIAVDVRELGLAIQTLNMAGSSFVSDKEW